MILLAGVAGGTFRPLVADAPHPLRVFFAKMKQGVALTVPAVLPTRGEKEPLMPELFAYTDGACSGNPGPGGWGVLLIAREGGAVVKERELSGGEALTTNNRMELLAAISALETLAKPSEITVVTDSAYVKNGVTEWIHGWKRNGWRTAGKDPVKNAELWQRLDQAQARHKVQWRWIKGHAGHEENERADALARAGMAPFKPAKVKDA